MENYTVISRNLAIAGVGLWAICRIIDLPIFLFTRGDPESGSQVLQIASVTSLAAAGVFFIVHLVLQFIVGFTDPDED